MGASKLCGVPRCPNLVPCPDHPKVPWAGSTRSRELPPDWGRRRRYVLERDPICTICHEALSTEVHHVGRGDDHSYDSLAGVCASCHQTATQRQAHGQT